MEHFGTVLEGLGLALLERLDTLAAAARLRRLGMALGSQAPVIFRERRWDKGLYAVRACVLLGPSQIRGLCIPTCYLMSLHGLLLGALLLGTATATDTATDALLLRVYCVLSTPV
jgi:hypothetical protein